MSGLRTAKYQTFTIRLPEDIIRQIRETADGKHVSPNRLVAETIIERFAARKQLTVTKKL